MAERGYFKSLLLRKSIDAVEVCVPLVAGTVTLLVVWLLDAAGVIGRFGPSSYVRTPAAPIGLGIYYSAGFFMMSAWGLLDAIGSSWRGVVDIVSHRGTATRVALEHAITTSSRPDQIVKTLARRYVVLSALAAFVCVLAAFALAMAGRHDLFGIVKSQLAKGHPEDPIMYIFAGVFASMAIAVGSRHLFVRWLEHDLADGRLR